MTMTDLPSRTEASRILDILGNVEGSILYRDTDGWRTLPPGEEGQVLTTGPDLLPYWADP